MMIAWVLISSPKLLLWPQPKFTQPNPSIPLSWTLNPKILKLLNTFVNYLSRGDKIEIQKGLTKIK